MADSGKRSAGAAYFDAQDFEPRKRGKYTQVACNECKRRKLKCSGEDVCKRCASNAIPCVYAVHNRPTTSEEPQNMDKTSGRLQTLESRMSIMQRQLDFVSAELAAIRNRPQHLHQPTQTLSTSNKPTDNRWTSRAPVSPSYVGPMSSEFGLNVPNDVDAPDLDETGISENVHTSMSNSPYAPPVPSEEENIDISSSNPLLSLTEAEALRLVNVYEDAVGLMYPVVDLKSIREYIIDSYHQNQDSSTGQLSPPQNGNEEWWFSARDTEVLKIVLALALISESHGRSDLGNALAASVENTFASTRTQVPEVDMKELIILALVALYHSCRDDDVLAWRTIGLAARGAMQMGLHSSDTWRRTGGIFPGDLERSWAINLFWCIYVFDKEFSFETGLPFAMRDSDMDSTLPEPADTHTYLACMIAFCRIGGMAWDLTVGWGSTTKTLRSEDKDYLSRQIHEWRKSLPSHLSLDVNLDDGSLPLTDPKLAMPQILLRLRANQMTTLIYKQDLLNASKRTQYPGARTAVYSAVDTIKTICKTSYISTTYLQRPQPFNRFLFSALATLFLGMFHAPHGFADSFRDNIPVALNALKRSSTRGKHSRRLHKVMKNLKRLNIKRPNNNIRAPVIDTNAHSSHVQQIPAGVHPALTSNTQPTNVDASIYAVPPSVINGTTPDDYSDLTNFFEFAGDYFMDPQLISRGDVNDTEIMPSESSQYFQSFIDTFQAEDETLTRLMAGLL